MCGISPAVAFLVSKECRLTISSAKSMPCGRLMKWRRLSRRWLFCKASINRSDRCAYSPLTMARAQHYELVIPVLQRTLDPGTIFFGDRGNRGAACRQCASESLFDGRIGFSGLSATISRRTCEAIVPDRLAVSILQRSPGLIAGIRPRSQLSSTCSIFNFRNRSKTKCWASFLASISATPRRSHVNCICSGTKLGKCSQLACSWAGIRMPIKPSRHFPTRSSPRI